MDSQQLGQLRAGAAFDIIRDLGIPTVFDSCRTRLAKEQGLMFSYIQIDSKIDLCGNELMMDLHGRILSNKMRRF